MSTEPARDLIPFVVNDYAGVPHSYETVLLPAGKGLPLSLALVKALGEPVLALLGDFGGEEGEETPGMSLEALGPALRGVDPEALAALGLRILEHTRRDGKPLSGHVFDKAYQGNYEEFYRALWEVIRANRMIPLLDTFMVKAKEATGTA